MIAKVSQACLLLAIWACTDIDQSLEEKQILNSENEIPVDPDLLPPLLAMPAVPSSSPSANRLDENQNFFTYCFFNRKGLVYFPTQNNQFVNGDFPLAIILHGSGFEYDQYRKLQNLLAGNFIASVSIEYTDGDFNEDEFLSVLNQHLSYLFDHEDPTCDPEIPNNVQFTRDIALIGHSMGGGMVAFAAKELSDPMKNQFNLRLHAVVSLAPNPYVNSGPYLLEEGDTPGLLTILGSSDNDINTNKPSSSAFLLYDESGYIRNEFTFNSYEANRFQKSMIYVEGADHQAHADVGDANDNWHINSYVNGYLQWRFSVLGSHYESANRSYFKFQLPMSIGENVSIQYSDANERLVLANFENDKKQFNSLGGQNIFQNFASILQNDSYLLDNKSPHHTRVLNLKWATGSTPSVRFETPKAAVGGYSAGAGQPEDLGLARYRYFMFRMGQINDTGYNEADLDFTITMRYYDANQNIIKSQSKKLSDFGKVPIPFSKGLNLPIISVMNSVILPIEAFDQVNFSTLVSVDFVFDQISRNSLHKGHIQLDNLEFVRY